MNLEDGERSGQPSAIDDDGWQLAIKPNAEATTWELTTTFGYTHSIIVVHLHDLSKSFDKMDPS